MIGSWDESLKTGNETIDSQHHQIFNLLDELKDELKSDNEVLRLLDKVMDFTMSHFLCEEELMTEFNYPSDIKKTMVNQHKEFKAYVRLRMLEFREGEMSNVIPFQSFVTNFLKDHELGLDRELVEWIHRENETSHAA